VVAEVTMPSMPMPVTAPTMAVGEPGSVKSSE
jgi:hypothetical protein